MTGDISKNIRMAKSLPDADVARRKAAENMARNMPFSNLERKRAPADGQKSVFSATMEVVTPTAPVADERLAKLPASVRSVAHRIAPDAAQLLGLIVQKYDAGGGQPVAMDRSGVAEAINVSVARADVLIASLTNQGLIVPAMSGVLAGFRPTVA